MPARRQMSANVSPASSGCHATLRNAPAAASTSAQGHVARLEAEPAEPADSGPLEQGLVVAHEVDDAQRVAQLGRGVMSRLSLAQPAFHGAGLAGHAAPVPLGKAPVCRQRARRRFRFRDVGAAPAMAVRSLGPPTAMSFRLAIGH
jgi:hypothetical protein